MTIPCHALDSRAAQIAAAETVLRHADVALASGEITAARILLDVLQSSGLFGAAFGAHALSESIERAQNRQDHFVDADETASPRSPGKAA